MSSCRWDGFDQPLKNLVALRCTCQGLNVASLIGIHCEGQLKIRLWQHALRLVWPLGNFQAGAGKQISKPSLFKLLRIVKSVEIEMPNGQGLLADGMASFVWFNHRVSGTFDAAFNAQSQQQMTHKSGLSCAQIADQFDVGVLQGRQLRQNLCESTRGSFIRPKPLRCDILLRSSYNRWVNTAHQSLSMATPSGPLDASALWSELQSAARELGFSQIGVTGVNLSEAEPGLEAWLTAGFHGSMNYMASHGLKRARPAELVPGTVSVITVRMDYLPGNVQNLTADAAWQELEQPQKGVVSVYARGRDYHKVLRSRLQKLQDRMAQMLGPFGHRVFTDSAPVMEAELAVRSGQGWRGKNTLVLQRDAGSFFFLGELFVDMALPQTEAVSEHCGSCTACMDVCPTQAIVAPYQLDARRCISYLTIEHAGPIPLEFRALIGNRIYGCDDCQWICPWNKFAKRSPLPDFEARDALMSPSLVDLLNWDEPTFLRMTEGSAIRRIGHARWLRNVALAAGNALSKPDQLSVSEKQALVQALKRWEGHSDPVVQEQVSWSLQQVG